MLKVRTSDGATLWEIGDAANVRAVAVDPVRWSVWAYGPQGLLRNYSFDGTLLTSVNLGVAANFGMAIGGVPVPSTAPAPSLGTPGLRDHVAMDVRTQDGSVYVAVGNYIYRYSVAGVFLGSDSLGSCGGLVSPPPTQGADCYVTGIGVLSDGSYWVASQTLVIRPGGTTTLSLPAGARVRDLDVENTSDPRVWIALANEVRRYRSGGALELAVPVAADHVAADGSLGAWLSSADSVIRVDANGNMSFEVSPFVPAVPVVDLVADPSDLSTWVTSGVVAQRIADDGESDLPLLLESSLRMRALGINADVYPPTLSFTSPAYGAVVGDDYPVAMIGYSDVGQGVDTSSLVVVGGPGFPAMSCVAGATSATCTATSIPPDGTHSLIAVVSDLHGNLSLPAVVDFTVIKDDVPPDAPDPSKISVSHSGGTTTVTGSAGAVEPGATVRLKNKRTGATSTTTAAGDGSFSGSVASQTGDEIEVIAVDGSSNESEPTRFIRPPVLSASTLDRTVATDFASSTRFLYTGPTAVQRGVVEGAIEARRVAVLRGKVLEVDGDPLPGVRVRIVGHPELGWSASRSTGEWDMAVNGGGPLVVRFDLPGYLEVDRTVDPDWREFAVLDPVRLTPLDTNETEITLTTSTTAFQVAFGSSVTDADGSRRTAIFVPPGLTGSMTLADGSTEALPSNVTLRATEFTVGAGGPEAMPGPLPRSSGYTHASELTVDEARARGAISVSFSAPVSVYVDDFLGVGGAGAGGVGTKVPVGHYDRSKSAWEALEDGRVIKYLSTSSGHAMLDVTGSGSPSNASDLAALGITHQERAALAANYSAGDILWRSRIQTFSPFDHNFPVNAKGDPPAQDPPPEEPETDCEADGSIIGCQSQTLAEEVPLTGSSMRLRYDSERAVGRHFVRTIPLTGPESVPSTLEKVHVRIEVAGRLFEASYTPAANLSYVLDWDWKDAYGRELQGTEAVNVRIGYAVEAEYVNASVSAPGGFGSPPTYPLQTLLSTSREYATLWQEYQILASRFDQKSVGLGGWSLTAHHVYDPESRIVFFGDGRTRSMKGSGISRIAGKEGVTSIAGDGGPALDATLAYPWDIEVGPDGSVYFADRSGRRVRKIDPLGTITTVAGTGSGGFSGDGGPAVNAKLSDPYGISLDRAGNLFIADRGNRRIRKVAPDGTISTIAGTGAFTYSGDGGLATSAGIGSVNDVLAHPDGSIYLTTRDSTGRVRRIDPNGYIATYAGGGSTASPTFGDDGPAVDASLGDPSHLALDLNGDILFSDPGTGRDRVWRIDADGVLHKIAGNGNSTPLGDGGPAVDAATGEPRGLAVASDGSIYIAGDFTGLIRRILPDGTITTIAGDPDFSGCTANGSDASFARLWSPTAIAFNGAGDLYYVDDGCNIIRKFGDAVAPVVYGALIPDGGVVHRFDEQGRHVETLDALTGAVRLSFAYSSGRLASITDANGNVLTIEHDGSGNPTTVVAPGGQETSLVVDAGGYLSGIQNPAGEEIELTTSGTGLLATFKDAKNNLYEFTYDSKGYLTLDEDPAGGSTALAKSDSGSMSTITRETALGRETLYRLAGTMAEIERAVEFPDGTKNVSVTRGEEEAVSTVLADGTEIYTRFTFDPRFGSAGRVPRYSDTITPGGLWRATSFSRSVTTAGASAPMLMAARTDTVTVNGKEWESVWEASSRTITSTTPEGRESVVTLDAQGRPIRAAVANLAPIEISYDARGRVDRVTAVAPDARVSTFSYDSGNRLVAATDPMGRSVVLEYDSADRVSRQTFADGRQISATWDDNGNVESLTPPGRPSHQFDYTSIDQESEYAPPPVAGSGSTSTEYGYNVDRQFTQVTRPDSATIVPAYSATTGRLITLTHSHETISTAFDTSGRLISLLANTGADLAFEWDAFLPLSESWSGAIAGSVERVFNDDFRIESESVNGTSPVSFSYDDDGLLTAAGSLSLTRNAVNGLLDGTTLGAVTTTRTHNSFAEPTLDTTSVSGTETFRVEYARDQLGRITARTESIGGVTSAWGYTYDAAGRLAAVSKDGSVVRAFAFDQNGNRVGKTEGTVIETCQFDDQDRLLSCGPTVGATTRSFTWSANGELTSATEAAGTTTFEYDALGNLRHVDLPNGDELDYVIDGRNRRVGKKVNGVEVEGFLYRDQLEPIAWLDSAGNVVARFVYGSKAHVPDYVVKSGVTYRIVSDHLGSVRLVINAATGAIAQRMDFDEWGNVTLDTAPGFQPFGFAGGILDAHTGLTRFGARDYDPRNGRWASKDPGGFTDGTNLYSYCKGDPINRIDLGGDESIPVQVFWWSAKQFLGPAAAAADDTMDTFGAVLDYFENKDALNNAPEKWWDDFGTSASRPDWYYHCMANCQASDRGLYGRAAAVCLGNLNEFKDAFKPNNTWEEAEGDLIANWVGRQGSIDGSCSERCSAYRFVP